MDDLAGFVFWGEAAEEDFFLGAFLDIVFVVGWPSFADFGGVGVVEDFALAGEGVGVDGFDAFEAFEVADAWVVDFAFEGFEFRQGAAKVGGAVFVFFEEDFGVDAVEVFDLGFGEVADEAFLFEFFEDVVSGDAVDVRGFGDFGNGRRAGGGGGEEDFGFFVGEAEVYENVGKIFAHLVKFIISFSMASK